jgi:hypothetical protein
VKGSDECGLGDEPRVEIVDLEDRFLVDLAGDLGTVCESDRSDIHVGGVDGREADVIRQRRSRKR